MSEYFSSEDHLISSQTDIQINMQLFIFFFLVLVTISSAKKLKNGPQILSEVSSSAESSHINDKRYVTPEFNLYFTPEDVQALQAMHSSQNSDSVKILQHKPVIGEEHYNELIQKFYTDNLKPTLIEKPQAEQKHAPSHFFLPREESIYNEKPNFNINTYRQLLKDQTKLSGHAQNAQKNNLNRLEFFKPASDTNRNGDQRKSFLEKEKEYYLRNGQIDQQFNSPFPTRSQNSDKIEGQDQSAVEKEIENAWKQYLTHEIKRLNSPVEISKEILSARKENPKNIDVENPISYILSNDRAYGFEKMNDPSEIKNQNSQGRNEGQNESEVEKEIKEFWSKQQDSKIHSSFYPIGDFNQGPLGINEKKKMSEVDEQIENIFNQQDFGFQRSFSPVVVSQQKASGKNKNQENLEVKEQSSLVLNKEQNKSDIEKEIENVLQKHQDYEFQRSKSAADAISRSLPIKIHEHVSITKHIPVPVVKTLHVAVPTPILVPIPQRYEVKVPQLYPVPLKIFKHVPVSVLNHD